MPIVSRRVLARPGLAVIMLLLTSVSPVMGQEPELVAPPGDGMVPAERVQEMVDTFQTVLIRAESGLWQEADAAFNGALDTMDRNRPALERDLGPPAVTVFGRIDALLESLVAALDAEDVPQLRVATSLIAAELSSLVTGDAAAQRQTDAVQSVLAWQSAADVALQLGAAQRWRDMRNAAMDLTDDIARRGPSVVDAAGEASQRDVDVARVFAMRLRAAALDQAPGDAQAAAQVLDAALERVLVSLDETPTPEPTRRPDTRLRLRGFEVESAPGEVVVVPVIAEDIPQIGLGALGFSAKWSPSALRLIDVTWDAAQGSLARDDVSGSAKLVVPQAPTGPSGDAIIASLTFEVIGGAISGRDYLPDQDIVVVDGAIADARTYVRQGDTPRAAAALSDAYVQLMSGGNSGLLSRLGAHGLADPLEASLLMALDLTSRPAETDVILISLSELEARVAATSDLYLERLARADAIPIALEDVTAADTVGSDLPVLDSIPGQVVLPGGVASGIESTPAAARPTVPPDLEAAAANIGPDATRPSALVTSTADAVPPGSEPRDDAGGGATLPLPLIAALLGAVALGIAAMFLGDRREP